MCDCQLARVHAGLIPSICDCAKIPPFKFVPGEYKTKYGLSATVLKEVEGYLIGYVISPTTTSPLCGKWTLEGTAVYEPALTLVQPKPKVHKTIYLVWLPGEIDPRCFDRHTSINRYLKDLKACNKVYEVRTIQHPFEYVED